jgi:hypothetical protein
MMIPDSIRPKSKHTPKGDEDSKEIGEQEHVLRLELEVLLDIPETKGRCNRASRLRDSQVGNLEERK